MCMAVIVRQTDRQPLTELNPKQIPRSARSIIYPLGILKLVKPYCQNILNQPILQRFGAPLPIVIKILNQKRSDACVTIFNSPQVSKSRSFFRVFFGVEVKRLDRSSWNWKSAHLLQRYSNVYFVRIFFIPSIQPI